MAQHQLTLPGLQASLDRLDTDQSLALARKDIDRLFGSDDITSARMVRFATGHRCEVSHIDGCVVFHKFLRK